MITVTFAGEKRQIENGTTVEQFLALENVETTKYVKVSVNEKYVFTQNYATQILQDGDVVEYMVLLGGG